MAEKVLDLTAITTLKTWITSKFATKEYVDENGGKIDTIKLNGTTQTITNKEVDLETATVTGDAETNNWIVKQGEQGDYLSVTHSVDDEGASTLFVEGWAADGSFALSLPSLEATEAYLMQFIPTDTSQLNNDSDFQSGAQVQALIDSELADITGIDFQVVQTLPATGAKGTIYLVPKGSTLEPPYNEFIWIEPDGGTAHYEQIGDTQIDLTGYWSKEEMTIATVAEINAILNA